MQKINSVLCSIPFIHVNVNPPVLYRNVWLTFIQQLIPQSFCLQVHTLLQSAPAVHRETTLTHTQVGAGVHIMCDRRQVLTNITDCASVVTCTFVPKPTPHIWLQMATSMNIAFILYLLHTFIFYHCYDSL